MSSEKKEKKQHKMNFNIKEKAEKDVLQRTSEGSVYRRGAEKAPETGLLFFNYDGDCSGCDCGY